MAPDTRISINAKLESEVMMSDRGVRMDLFVIKSDSILPSPYKGKNAMSEPASTLFHTFKCSFKKSPLRPANMPSRKRAAVWNTRPSGGPDLSKPQYPERWHIHIRRPEAILL